MGVTFSDIEAIRRIRYHPDPPGRTQRTLPPKLFNPAGKKLERLKVPRDWEGEFVTEVYKRVLRALHRQPRGSRPP
jgi:hypothetical protein